MSEALLASYVVLWILVIVLGVAVFALYHHLGELYLNSREGRVSQGPEAGKPFKPLEARALKLGPLSVPDGTATLIAFMEVGCLLCADLRHHLSEFAEGNAGVRVVAIVGGEPAAIEDFARSFGSRVAVISDVGGRITRRYGVAVFPFAVAVDQSGIVRMKDIVNERQAVEELARAALASADPEEEGGR